MMSKAPWRTVLSIAGAFALLGGPEWSRELYYRATLGADLKLVLSDLTPEDVVRQCGAPDGKVVRGFVIQELSYQRSGATICFIRTGSEDMDWAFTSFHEWFGRNKSRKDARQVLASMPCLNRGASATANRPVVRLPH